MMAVCMHVSDVEQAAAAENITNGNNDYRAREDEASSKREKHDGIEGY